MDKLTGLSFSLTKEDINLLLDSKNKIKRKIKWFSLLLLISVLCQYTTFGIFMECISNGIFSSAVVMHSLFAISTGLISYKIGCFSNRLEKYNTYMEQLKIDFQRLVGPNRTVNGKSFVLEKSNNVVKVLKRYSFLEQEVGTDCVTRSKQIVNDNLFIGTVSRQYVALDENGIIGAINELKLSDVERSATEDGCLERVVTRYEYSLCGVEDVRPYESEPLVRKRTKKKKNPQG